MDAVFLARLQFALTIGFHYIFPPLTIGLAWFIVWAMTKFIRSGDEIYRKIARFLSRIFTISFAVGVATGITMEFQFGMNWARYSRFVGDIFGAPLAAEIILSFFMESIFVAVLAYGWERFSERIIWFSSLMVAIGATLSAFWIIVANSWMQTPAGYILDGDRAVLADFWAAMFNPSLLPRFLHTLDGALMTGAFFVLGVAAWFAIKGLKNEFVTRMLKTSLIVAFISSVAQLGFGHYHAIQVAFTQPEKLAAIEGVFETQANAPSLLFGIPDEEKGEMRYAVKVPGLLSLLAFGNLNATVKGLNDFPRNEWPPLALTFFPFHLMVGLGMYFIGLGAFGVWIFWRKKIFENKFFLRLAIVSIPLTFIANELGWITAEVGRQPWIVYHLIKTKDAISASVPANHILASIIMFGVIYALLFAAWIYLLRHVIKKELAESYAGANNI